MKVKILSEDQQQHTFVRRVLQKLIGNIHVDVEEVPQGEGGAGDQWVREKYVKELELIRRKRHQDLALVVVIDGDKVGVTQRTQQLEQYCARNRDDKVAFFVPTRNIETWLAYLGGENVDESIIYPKLKYPSECKPQVKAMADMCRQKQLRQPAPASLQSACDEYQRLSQ